MTDNEKVQREMDACNTASTVLERRCGGIKNMIHNHPEVFTAWTVLCDEWVRLLDEREHGEYDESEAA
jgi:hypothetical protein